MEKLSKLFDQPKESFQKLVEENPGVRFRGLLEILRNQGVKIDEQKLEKMRE